MIIPLSEIQKQAEGLKNPAVVFEAKLRPRWLARILNRFYKPLEVWCGVGNEVERERLKKLVEDIDKQCAYHVDEIHCTCWPYAKDRLLKYLYSE